MDTEDLCSEQLTITEAEAGQRLDKILSNRFQSYSRTYLQELIASGHVTLNGASVKKRIQLRAGDEVEMRFSLSPEIGMSLIPEPIPFEILFEDDDLIVVNKPPGLVVHPAAGNWSGTFVNGLLHHCRSLEPCGEPFRPGIVHRLDKDTSGVLIAAKTSMAHQRLVHLFASRQVHKEYLAICGGNPGEGVIDAPIGRHPHQRKLMAVVPEGGRIAKTRYQTVAVHGELSLVQMTLITGRTHQARVHMRHRGTPILGDPVYGSGGLNERYERHRQMLHAQQLQLVHPMTGALFTWKAPLPPDMQELVTRHFF